MAKDATTQSILDSQNALNPNIPPMTQKNISGIGTVNTNYDITPQMAADMQKAYSNSQSYGANGVNNTVVSGNSGGLSSYSPPSLIDLNTQLVTAQKAAKLAGLQKAYDRSLSQLNQQDALIDPNAYNDRAKTSTASQLGAKNFAEFLANRGQVNSGFADQSELNRNMQLQSDIGAIDLQARNAHNDIATKKTDLNNALQNDIQSANSGIEADSLQRQIQLAQQEQARQDQLEQFAKTYGLDLAQLTGTINGTPTQQALLNKANIANTQANTENQSLQNKELSDPQSVTNQLKQLGLDTSKLDYKLKDKTTQAQIDSILADVKSKNISNDVAQYQLNELNDPYSLTNQLKAIEIAQKDQDLTASKAQYEEWLQLAPQRIKQEQEQTLQASDAARLARLQVQVENEELLAKKIDTSFLNQQQKDQHAKVLADLADTKSAIANRAAQLSISQQELNERKREFNATLENKTTSTKYNYKNDTNFQSDYAKATQNPDNVYKNLKANPQAFISEYGIDGFKALLSVSAPKGTDINALLNALNGGK